MKKTLAALLVVILLLGTLAACTTETPDETLAETGEQTQATETVTLIEKNGKTDYNVFYEKNATARLQSGANALSYKISDVYKVSVNSFNEKISDDKNTEICVGNLDKPESKEAMALLKGEENEYLIKYFPSGRLVFVGSNDDSIVQAIYDFIDKYITNGDKTKLVIEKDLEIYVKLADTERAEWKLSGVPEYTAGVLASNTYNIGYGIACTSNIGRMHTVSETTEAEFDAYVETLKNEGFKVDSTNEVNGNKYVEFTDKNNRVLYVYYIPSLDQVRIIQDNNSRPESQFEYTYEPKEGEFTAFYQFGMMYDPRAGGAGQFCEEKYPNCGAFHIIKLADNSLILIDGGDKTQATDNATAALVDFLYEITGKEKGEKIRVACWYLSHAHGDHYGFASQLFNNYTEYFELERVMHNLTSEMAPSKAVTTNLLAKYPNVMYLKPHQGQKIQLGDVTIDILLTHETLTHPTTNASYIADYNDTSDIIKFTMNGKTLTYFGDWGGQWTIHSVTGAMDSYRQNERILLGMYLAEDGTYPALEADIMQVAHHAINDWLDNVYKAVNPDYAFIPQADVKINLYQGSCFQEIIYELRAMGVPDDHMFHANRFTHWLEIAQDGTITHKYVKLAGADEGYYYYTTADGKILYIDEDGNVNTDKVGVMIKDNDGLATFEDISGVTAKYEKGYWDYVNKFEPFSSFKLPEEV